MFSSAKLIYHPSGTRCPVFRKRFSVDREDAQASLTVSALGIFQVFLNGEKIGNDVLSPGFEVYEKRIGAVTYTAQDGFLPNAGENIVEIIVTPGWYSGRIRLGDRKPEYPLCAVAEMKIDGRKIVTNSSWQVADSRIVSSDIYDGIRYDARLKEDFVGVSCLKDFDMSLFEKVFRDGEGAPVVETETVFPSERILVTPRGETVLDFGVNLVGYPVLTVDAEGGEEISLSFAEVLDKDGNFYTDNYRGARCVYDYVCKRGKQFFAPIGTFYGFRYVRINSFAGEYAHGTIAAKVIHTDMPRTGFIRTGNSLVNRLFDNVIRGQNGNYVDIPTDCPQRDERMGWTGDAEAFIRAASYNYYVLDFFRKWLHDAVLSQNENGSLPDFVPHGPRFGNVLGEPTPAWTDFITIIPYALYRAYGDKTILEDTFDAMRRYVDCIGRVTKVPDLWVAARAHYGDWLALDAAEGSYLGASDTALCASAYYANSVDILCKVGEVLHEDMTDYYALHDRIRKKFIETYVPKLKTQTEFLLTLAFGLTDDVKDTGDRLVAKIHADGDKLSTGFMGTGFILHVLSAIGQDELAYTLLLRTEYPSWLYPVTKGATTIWEHWDGIKPDGSFWNADMNSFNHYAYGSVADWLYAVAAGITPETPGYETVRIEPHPDKRLGTLDVSYLSMHGNIRVNWYYEDDTVHYHIETPVNARILLGDTTYDVERGTYDF